MNTPSNSTENLTLGAKPKIKTKSKFRTKIEQKFPKEYESIKKFFKETKSDIKTLKTTTTNYKDKKVGQYNEWKLENPKICKHVNTGLNAVPIAITLTTAITSAALGNPLSIVAANTTGALIGSSASILGIKALEGKITQNLGTNETKAILALAKRGASILELENENKKQELALQREQFNFFKDHPEILAPSIAHEENLLLIDNNHEIENENNRENGWDHFANNELNNDPFPPININNLSLNNDPFPPINNLSLNNPQNNYPTLQTPAIPPRPKNNTNPFNTMW